jgi:hypothetical protein
LKQYALGLVILIAAYVLLTAFRDFRDNFSAEVWITLGYGDAPEIFTLADAPTAFIVVLVLGATIIVSNNQHAVKLYHLIVIAGAAMVGLATLAFQLGLIGGVAWMMLISLGLYLAYVPFNCILFDRLMAAVKSAGNAGFMIYVADASGYVGSVALLLYKSFAAPTIDWLPFIEWFAYITSIGGVSLMALSLVYFSTALERKQSTTRPITMPTSQARGKQTIAMPE